MNDSHRSAWSIVFKTETVALWLEMLTGQDGLDAVEYKSDREQRGKFRDGFRHCLPLSEDITDVVAKAEDDDCQCHRYYEGEHRHHEHRECCWLGIARAQFVAYSNTAIILK